MLQTQIIALVVLIFLSAFFSGIETALISVHIAKVRALVKQKKKGSKALQRIKKNPHKLIITILIGNNLVNITAAALATYLFTNLFGSKGVGLATGVMTFLILVFGEITPKVYAARNSEKISLFVARPVEILSLILWPLVKFFELMSKGIQSLTGNKTEKKLSEEEIRTVVTMGIEEGILSREAAEIMHNVIEFDETPVKKIMVPKKYIESVDGNSKLKEAIPHIVKKQYSRYPVYLKNKDNIIGVIDVDDILKYVKNNKLDVKVKQAVRKIKSIPEEKEIDDLLFELEGKKIPLAIVINKYGHVSGLVTIEDILEEIVGEIFDKSRKRSVYITEVGDNLARVDGKASVQEVNKILKLGLNIKRFNTLAGFIKNKLKRVPKKGEKIYLKKSIIEIDKVSKNRVERVKIIKV